MFCYNSQISWFKFHHSCGRIGKLRKFERASHWETESTPRRKTTLWAKVTSSPFCKYASFGLNTNSPYWALYVTYRTCWEKLCIYHDDDKWLLRWQLLIMLLFLQKCLCVLNISENNIDSIEELKCLKNMTQFFIENNCLSDMKVRCILLHVIVPRSQTCKEKQNPAHDFPNCRKTSPCKLH